MPGYRLGVVLTGGTIGSSPAAGADPVGLAPAPAPGDLPDWTASIVRAVGLPAPLVEAPVRRHSEELRPEHWSAIAAACRRLQDRGAQAICVLHGTDTLAFTAAALALSLADLEVPVALTGSNHPPASPDSDAEANLRGTLVALNELPAGVYVVFAGTPDGDALVHLGTRVRKEQTSGVTFASPVGGPVARVHGQRLERLRSWPSPRPAAAAQATFDPRVLGLTLHPGLPFAALQAAVEAGGLRGAVVELYPCGTGPTGDDDPSLERFAAFLATRGGVTVGVVAAPPEAAAPVYPSLPLLQRAGLLLLPGVLPGTATVKLMWALAATDADPERTRELLRRNVAGELPDDA